MNVVMIIPTGIGCKIGGHAGDATPVAKLLASVCDTLILHPNVVNASDINEMPPNSLYVEGSMLDRFLQGQIELQRVRKNKILVAVNKPLRNETYNAVSAARATMGIDAEIMLLHTPLELIAEIKETGATGEVRGWQELADQAMHYDFDALAISTPITLDDDIALKYLIEGGINPWGGVEARASKLISKRLNKPVAHAPIEMGALQGFNERVDPRQAAEVVSIAYLNCVLKGLHKAPQIGKGLSVQDIDVLVSPYNCCGKPHKACLARNIPIIAVRENQTCVKRNWALPRQYITVDNYWEAAGIIAAMKAGIEPNSVRRPLEPTKVYD